MHIKTKAKRIAEIILSTDTDKRGEMFFLTAKLLGGHCQYFTAMKLNAMAEAHGFNVGLQP